MAKAKISDFRPQERNANRHTPRGLGMLDKSMADNGFIGAMTSAADGEIFDGSARLETAYDRFGEEIEPIVINADGTRPIIVVRTDIPSADHPKAKKLSIAANRIPAVDLDWDPEMLKAIGEEVDISDLFFDNEIENLFEKLEEDQDWELEEEKEEDDDALAEILDNIGKVESRVKLGEIWQLGRHKIACGDSTIEANVRALLGDRFGDVGMVWSDPPFNTKQQQGRTSSEWGIIENDNLSDLDFKKFAEKFVNIVLKLKPESIYVCCNWRSYPLFFSLLPDINNLIVWVKNNFGLGSGYRPQHELIIFRGKIESNSESNVWNIGKDSANSYNHPMQKPIELIEKAFANSTQINDLIFDPFLGSAPSIIAAQKMEGDRTVYGFELSPDYCQVIIERYENFTGDIARLVGTL